MKLFKLTLLSFTLSLAVSSLTHAGGVTCKQCPAESNACAPKPGCREDQPGSQFSDTLHCIQGGLPKSEFTLQENTPYQGQALVISKTGQSQILKFTQDVKRMITRHGPVERYQKTFFHPYFEYRIYGELDLNSSNGSEDRPINYSGSYLAEQNQQAEVSCKVIAQKQNF